MDMTLQTLYGLLENHDWYYEYSDDGRVYRAGRDAEMALREASKESAAHLELYSTYHEYVFSGPAWNTEKKPKPASPA